MPIVVNELRYNLSYAMDINFGQQGLYLLKYIILRIILNQSWRLILINMARSHFLSLKCNNKWIVQHKNEGGWVAKDRMWRHSEMDRWWSWMGRSWSGDYCTLILACLFTTQIRWGEQYHQTPIPTPFSCYVAFQCGNWVLHAPPLRPRYHHSQSPYLPFHISLPSLSSLHIPKY